MKKLICLGLVVLMLFSATGAIFASDARECANGDNERMTEEVYQTLYEIPIFVTYISDWNEETVGAVKEDANDAIKRLYADTFLNNTDFKGPLKATVETAEYKVSRLVEAEKTDILYRVEFFNTFKRAYELIKHGVAVNHINLFVKENDGTGFRGDPNDPSTWESFPPLCLPSGNNVYNGYTFLYAESSVSVETTPTEAPNASTMNWTTIVGKTTRLLADRIVNSVFYDTVTLVYDALSAVFSGHTAPYSVTYGTSGGYLKTWVSGDLYIRTILISDNLNQVPGYAYYMWGHLEQLKIKTKVDAKWPISVRPGGTYNYDTNTFTSATWKYFSTPGFYGNNALYQSVISLYQNPWGYFTHEETIDVDAAIASLV